MTRLIYALLAIVPLVSSVNGASAQTPSLAEADSIELAAARYVKQHLPADGRTISFDARTRAGQPLTRTRSAAQSGALAKALGAGLGEFACAVPAARKCARMTADIGIVLQTPTFVGDVAEIVVETHTPGGTGIETYVLERDGLSWRVSRVAARRAVSGVRHAAQP
jgi:hypothetical protein